MESFPIFLRKSSIIVIFKKRIKPCQKFLSQLHNPLPQSPYINPLSFQLLPQHFQTSLIPRTISIITRLEIRMVFVDTVICEMDIWIFQILFSWRLVILNTKSCQTLLIQITDVGTNRRDKYVHPQIEFSFVQKQRFIDIGLNYPLLGSYFRYIPYLFNQTYPVSLRTHRWLGYKYTSIFYLLLQFLLIIWEEIGFRVEPKMFRPVFTKFIEHETESSLMAEMGHGRNPIDLHLSSQVDLILRKCQSRPQNIPTFKHLLPIILLTYSFYQFELSPRMAGINLHLLLSCRMFLWYIEL